MDPPYPTKRPWPRPGQLARQWYNSNGAYSGSGTEGTAPNNAIDVPERALYRVTQYVNDSPVLLKDFKDKSPAPRVLLFRKANAASLAHDENGRLTELDDLKLQVFDEVLVSQYAPWINARGAQAMIPDAPIRVGTQDRMIFPHAEATVIWLSKRCPKKRCVSFVEKRRQFGKERGTGKVHLRADVIDPANMRSTFVTAQKIFAQPMILRAFRYSGLPVYLDYSEERLRRRVS